MQIRHERPMSDLSFQVRAPLKLTLATGRDIAIDRWSLASLHYPEQTDILPKAALLTIPFQGVEIQFPVSFEAGTGEGELIFKDLTGRQRETLSVFYRSILSGKMAGTDDVITSLDTPVDLVPMGETDEEIEIGSAAKSPRLLRAIWTISLYTVVACLVFGLIGGKIWNRLSHVNLDHARVVAPVVAMHSPEAAHVDKILVAVGDVVRQGQVLVRLSNPERSARLTETRADVAKAEARVRDARQVFNRHMQRLDQARAPLLAAYEAAIAARSIEDFLADRGLESVRATKALLDAFDATDSITPGDYHDVRRTLQGVLVDRKSDLSRLKRKLRLDKESDDSAHIVASVDGTVTQIDVFRDQFIGRGIPIISVEENTARTVQAWMNQGRSDAIYVGMATTIRFQDGSGTRSIPGTISDIVAGIDPMVSNNFGIIVTATLDNLEATETRQMFRADAPVMMRAIKPWAVALPWEG